MNRKLHKSVLALLGGAALAGFATQASAIAPPSLGVIASGGSATVSDVAPKRAFSDSGTGFNYGWTHTAAFDIFQIGTASDVAAGARFNVTVDLKQNGTSSPMNFPGFAIWTSGSTPMVAGAANGNGYGHKWSQVRGPSDGGVAGDPCGIGGDCALGSNGWLGTGGGGNIVTGHDGWVGYANAGYSFANGDGDKLQGLLAGSSNPSNIGQYSGGAALTNVNGSSPYVNGGGATLSSGDAFLSLVGLKAGYYLVGYAGSCPDNNLNGQNCGLGGNQAYTLTINNTGSASAVPIPAAAWLFGSALGGLGVFGRRKDTAPA